MAGAPIGNRNAQKGKMWNDALRKAITQDNGERLRAAIEQLLNLASNGEPWAIRELADRLDGRPKQINQMENEGSEITTISVIFVKPENAETKDLNSQKISN